MAPKKSKIFKDSEIVVILDNLRSTFNVGAIFRTSDALNVKKIYLCGITPTPKNPKIQKTALGAEKTVSWEKVKQYSRLFKKLKKDGFYLIAIEQDKKSKNILTLKKLQKRKIALILGSEVKGLSRKILNQVDLILEIPMWGTKESLNIAVAFGISGYLIKKLLLF
ncbi:MAG: TrmH family RNA methyltransferase [Minisyncoccia bacterium]|jgi:tRNA G18 (ribose-2'-O)-methylase SpoU